MKKISNDIIQRARNLRQSGLSHRKIADQLSIGYSTVAFYTKDIALGNEQRLNLRSEAYKKLTTHIISVTSEQRREWSRQGGLNTSTHFKVKYSKETLITMIQKFYLENGCIPIKHEFSQANAFRRRFGSWNNAILAAGFKPNPVNFAYKHTSVDGHQCDSLAEKIIDEWLFLRKISHERNAPYGNTKFTADFKVGEIYIEFFGLKGHLSKYDNAMLRKMKIINELGLTLISIYPSDLFPVSKLNDVLSELCTV